jgi:hypothetical protein
MCLDDGEYVVEAAHPRRDGDHTTDACPTGARKHGIKLTLEFRKVEMTMAIDDHQTAGASASM